MSPVGESKLLFMNGSIFFGVMLVTLVVAAAVPQTNPAAADDGFGPEVGGLRAKVALERQTFTVGQPIMTRYIVRNVSKDELIVWHSGFWPNHRIIVTDAEGADVKPTERGKEARKAFSPGGAHDKNFPMKLPPGQEDDSEGAFDLTRYYELNRPGHYAVQILYEEKQGGWQGRLESNRAAFEVTAKP